MRLPHRLRNPSPIIRNRNDGLGPTDGDAHMEVSGMRKCLDGVEQEIRDYLEDLALYTRANAASEDRVCTLILFFEICSW
jgi:hypothetical protein